MSDLATITIDIRKFGALATYPANSSPWAEDLKDGRWDAHDQSDKIQAAIDAVAKHGRGTVVIPSYNDCSYILRRGLVLRPGVRLSGEGPAVAVGSPGGKHGALLYAPAASTPAAQVEPMFRIESAETDQYIDSITVCGLSFCTLFVDGQNAEQNAVCFSLKRPSNVTIEDVLVKGFAYAVVIEECIYTRILRCRFLDQSRVGVHVKPCIPGKTMPSTTLRFDDCYVQNVPQGIVIEPGALDVTLRSCVMEGCAQRGLDLGTSVNAWLYGCYTEHIGFGEDGGELLRAGYLDEATRQALLTLPQAALPRPTNVFVYGGMWAGPNGAPTALRPGKARVGFLLDYVGVAQISSCEIHRVDQPLATSPLTQRIEYTGNTHLQIGTNYAAGIQRFDRLIGHYPGNAGGIHPNVLGSIPRAQLELSALRFHSDARDDFKLESGYSTQPRELCLTNASGTLAMNVWQQGLLRSGAFCRIPQQLPDPSTPNSSTASRSPTDDEWLFDDDGVFARKFGWMPAGTFSVVRETDERFHMVVHLGQGKRRSVSLSLLLPLTKKEEKREEDTKPTPSPDPTTGAAVLEVLDLQKDEPLAVVKPAQGFRLSGRNASVSTGTITNYVFTLIPFGTEPKP